jgi:hypothetical protein
MIQTEQTIVTNIKDKYKDRHKGRDGLEKIDKAREREDKEGGL